MGGTRSGIAWTTKGRWNAVNGRKHNLVIFYTFGTLSAIRAPGLLLSIVWGTHSRVGSYDSL